MRNPYVTDSFVHGRKHYGRTELIEYLLQPGRRASWVVGTHHIGKTSLLRQLELEAAARGSFLPLYWDMQGSDSVARLGQYLVDAASAASKQFIEVGVPPEALRDEDLGSLLPTLRRAAAKADRELLLLCDEADALLHLVQQEPEALQRLHRELMTGPGLRTVVVSTRAVYQFNDLCQDWPTASFLSGFEMSQILGRLSEQAARALIMQLQESAPVHASPELLEVICEHTNNHPYLLQVLCSRLFQSQGALRGVGKGDLDVDAAMRGFFSLDFQALTPTDRELVQAVHRSGVTDERTLLAIAGDAGELRLRLHNLQRLGYLRRVYGQLALGNQFLENWLGQAQPDSTRSLARETEVGVQAAVAHQHAQEYGFLQQRLNQHRGRLVELEAIRARDLLSVSPAVLVEIEQLQTQVRHLRQLMRDLQAGQDLNSNHTEGEMVRQAEGKVGA